MYQHWGCTSIYRPLSYHFRSLNRTLLLKAEACKSGLYPPSWQNQGVGYTPLCVQPLTLEIHPRLGVKISEYASRTPWLNPVDATSLKYFSSKYLMFILVKLNNPLSWKFYIKQIYVYDQIYKIFIFKI